MSLTGGVTTPQTLDIYSNDNGSTFSRIRLEYSGGSPRILSSVDSGGAPNLSLGLSSASTLLEIGSGSIRPTTDRGFNLGDSTHRFDVCSFYDVVASNTVQLTDSSHPRFSNPATNAAWMHVSQAGGSGDIRLGFGDAGSNGAAIFCPSSSGRLQVCSASDTTVYRMLVALSFGYSGTAVADLAGSGDPEGVVTSSVGSTYRRTDGGAGTSFYIKQSGSGNTGWAAVTP